MNDLQQQYVAWKQATSELPWGVAKAFKTVLDLASEGKTTLAYNADFNSDGSPCLVNTVGVMLKATHGKAGHGLPSQHFHKIVGLFDGINTALYHKGINSDQRVVSPTAANILFSAFGEPNDLVEATESEQETYYTEPSDEAMLSEMMNLFCQSDTAEVEAVEDTINGWAAVRVDPNQS